MRMESHTPSFESFGSLDEKSFSIGDLGMVFDILRSKMYSNPILAICREISCNARDAHREAGIPERPIKIQLPTSLEPELRIQDFGVGISPDRVDNIFVKFAASTKRNDNTQTGFFGLGSKSPFSYTDQFMVNTIFNGVKYNYVCSIDSTKVGKMVLLNQVNTDEHNGTEVVIPAKSQDFKLFNQYIEQACRYWEVKPIITGGNIKWQLQDIIFKGSNWCIVKDDYYYGNNISVMIDGIEYPLDHSALSKYADSKLVEAARGKVILYFSLGELSLSANREQVYLDKHTQEKIKLHLEQAVKEVKLQIHKDINKCSSLWEANMLYAKLLSDIFQDVKFVGTVHWKSIPCMISCPNLNCKVFHYSWKDAWSSKTKSYVKRLLKYTYGKLEFIPNSIVYINDLGLIDPVPARVKKAFENDPKLERVQLICPTSQVTEDVLNKTINLQHLNPHKLSTITNAPKHKSQNFSGNRLLVFKFDSNCFSQVAYKDYQADQTKTKVLCELKVHTNYYSKTSRELTLNGADADWHLLSLLRKENANVVFYGIDKDTITDPKVLKKKFGDCISLNDYIKARTPTSIDAIELAANIHSCYRFKNSFDIDFLNKLSKHIKDKNGCFLKAIDSYNKIMKYNEKYEWYYEIYCKVNKRVDDAKINAFLKAHPEQDLISCIDKINKKYPLMNAIDDYNINNYITDLAQYINIMDTI